MTCWFFFLPDGIMLHDPLLCRQQLFEQEHYSPMSSVLPLWPALSFIGRLEHFQRDWDRVNEIFWTDMRPHDKHLGEHVTSNNPNRIKENTLQLLRKFPSYERALCHLFLVDYVCFSYALPEACSDITPPHSLGCKNATVLNAALGNDKFRNDMTTSVQVKSPVTDCKDKMNM